ncbi:MAG TPA: ABC transporter permease [Solirubrobacteraceae bacterium]|jgi:osmoprotectant transport system permease protein|nr:ABC transporter permease [Solirubrobacteraceae bacterium]
MTTLLDALRFIGHNGALPSDPAAPTLVHLTLQMLWISGIGIAISLAVGLPIGAWLGHLHRFSFAAINISNIGRALPSLAVLAIGDAILGLGLTVTEVALVILAAPIVLTNAYVGIAGVDPEVVDAARGMGMTGWRILWRVEVPLAIPLLFAGIRTAAVYVVATATIASLAGYNGGLGYIISDEQSYHLSGVLGAAICVAALALLVEGVLALAQRQLTPRGVRLEHQARGEEDVDALVPAAAAISAP